jgi:hypothetical protein
MHLFEYALRDFMNAEKYAHSGSLMVVDDIFPNHEVQARRQRQTSVWTGDVWKLFHCLSYFRPDLIILPLDCSPTGLLLVAGLDRENRVLWNRYNAIVARYNGEDQFRQPPKTILRRDHALDPGSPVVGDLLMELRGFRDGMASVNTVRAALKRFTTPLQS